jgi:hypothetical protein
LDGSLQGKSGALTIEGTHGPIADCLSRLGQFITLVDKGGLAVAGQARNIFSQQLGAHRIRQGVDQFGQAFCAYPQLR